MTGHTARESDSSTKPLLHILISTLSILLTAPIALAQSIAMPAANESHPYKLPEFTVAVIKPNKNGGGGSYMFTPSGINIANYSPQLLIRMAYGIEDDQIIAAPPWVKSERYDIEAKVDASDTPAVKTLTPEQRNQMMQPLLEDRFRLKFHYETRELPIYMLVVAKSGFKQKEIQPTIGPDGVKRSSNWSYGNGSIKASDVPIDTFAHILTLQLERIVLNKTDLTANYNFTLKWTPDDSSHTDATGPSIFTAVQEQLGLKLEAGKAPIQVLVIDHIERPSEN